MNPATLDDLLRCQLSAVHQQFIHILVLRVWGHKEMAERIAEVDNRDFPCAMRIIDCLIGAGRTPNLRADSFTPGQTIDEIITSELDRELRLVKLLEAANFEDAQSRELGDACAAPRESYRKWLEQRVEMDGEVTARARVPHPETSRLLAMMLAMIEQSMTHAFVHWHCGQAAQAHDAWTTSGAAMMHLTRMVRAFAAENRVPVPGPILAPQVFLDPSSALDADRQLAADCVSVAREAADACDHGKISGLCEGFARLSSMLAVRSSDEPHPAYDENPPALRNFSIPLQRYVHS